MPKEGYKTITVREETYKRLQAFAEKGYMTIPRAVEYLLDKIKEGRGVA